MISSGAWLSTANPQRRRQRSQNASPGLWQRERRRKVVHEIFFAILSREPTSTEIEAGSRLKGSEAS